MTDLATHVGTLVKNMKELHNTEFKIGFGLHANTFFQKLVSLNIIQGQARIRSDGFYKGLLFLDYYCNIINNDCKVCENLVTISKKLNEVAKEKGIDTSLRYLPLECVVVEAGLCSLEKGEDYYKNELDAIEQRYMGTDHKKEDMVVFTPRPERKADPYYEAMGLMVADLVSDERRDTLKDVTNRHELQAVVFSDCALNIIKDQKYITKTNEQLKNKDYLKASMTALEGLMKESTLSLFDSYIVIQDE